MRLVGAAGRGIADSDGSAQVRNIRQTPGWLLATDAAATLRRCLRYGTTTIDVKSCLGLDDASDLKALKLLTGLGKDQPIELISTYCGTMAIPPGYEGRADDYVAHLISHVLPMVREKKLADSVAVNRDLPIFDERQSTAIIAAAVALGFSLKFCGEGGPRWHWRLSSMLRR